MWSFGPLATLMSMNIHELPKNERWEKHPRRLGWGCGCFWLALKNELERERFKDAKNTSAIRRHTGTHCWLKGARVSVPHNGVTSIEWKYSSEELGNLKCPYGTRPGGGLPGCRRQTQLMVVPTGRNGNQGTRKSEEGLNQWGFGI